MGFRLSLYGSKEPTLENVEGINKLRQTIRDQQKQQKNSFDQIRYQPKSIAVNDLVLMYALQILQQLVTAEKVIPKWRDQIRVTIGFKHDRDEVAEVKGGKRSQIPHIGVSGLENIKPLI